MAELCGQTRGYDPHYSGEKAQACLDIMDNFIDDAIGLFQTMSGEKWE